MAADMHTSAAPHSNSGGLIRAAVREFGRIGDRSLYLCLGLGLPLLVFGIFTALFSNGIIQNLPVAVLDLDNSSLSRTYVRMADGAQGVQMSLRVRDFDQGRRAVETGQVHGLLVLPEDMERDVLRGQGATPIFYYNNQLLLMGGIMQRSLGKVGATLSAGIDLKRRMKTGDSRAAALARLEPVAVDTKALFNPYLNYAHYVYLALLPAMFMIACCVLTIYALASEIKAGTCGEWLAAGGGSATAAVLGKLIPHTLMLVICGGVMHLLFFKVLGFPFFGHAGFILLGTLVFILACQACCVLIFALARNMDTAVTMASVYSASAFAFAGVTFPAPAMPPLAQLYSDLVPLTHYMVLLTDQVMRGAAVHYSLPAFNILLAFVFVCGFLGLILTRLPGGVFHGKGAQRV